MHSGGLWRYRHLGNPRAKKAATGPRTTGVRGPVSVRLEPNGPDQRHRPLGAPQESPSPHHSSAVTVAMLTKESPPNPPTDPSELCGSAVVILVGRPD